jgi:predicted nucleic acid-binding protein
VINTSLTYCVDASLVSRIITGASSHEISSLVKEWDRTQPAFVAPGLLGYEIANVLHRSRARGLADSLVRQAFDALESMSIQLIHDPTIHADATDIARTFSHAASYDAHYLVVALRHQVEFWTCDRRLANSVRARYGWVHFVDPDESS